MSNFRVVSILFHLDSSCTPFKIIEDIENHFHEKNCVIAINAYCGDIIICTLFGKNIVPKVKSSNTVLINKKMLKYKLVESNVTSICIQLAKTGQNIPELNNNLTQFGKILKCDILDKEGRAIEDDLTFTGDRYYHAIIDLRKDLPTQLFFPRIGNINITQVE